MEAIELRVKNLVEDPILGVLEIQDIFGSGQVIAKKDNITFNLNLSQTKGVPLKEEWLLKFGWSYYNGKTEGVLTKDFGCKMDVDYVDGVLLIKSHYEGEEMYRETKVKFIHQLQNLYFALTGEELTLKKD